MPSSHLEERETPGEAFALYSIVDATRDEVAAHSTSGKLALIGLPLSMGGASWGAVSLWGVEAWSTQLIVPASLVLPWVLCIRLVFHAHERYQSVRAARSMARSRFMMKVPDREPGARRDEPWMTRARVTFKVHLQIYGGKLFSILGICGSIVAAMMSLSFYFIHTPASPEYASDVCRIVAMIFAVLGGFLLALHALAFVYNVLLPDESERQEILTELQIRRVRLHGEDVSGGLSLGAEEGAEGGLSVHRDSPHGGG